MLIIKDKEEEEIYQEKRRHFDDQISFLRNQISE